MSQTESLGAASAPIEPQMTAAKRLALLREGLKPFRDPSTTIALALVCLDVALFALGQAIIVGVSGITAKIGGALITWIGIVRLFLIGHDACHGAFTGREWLNALIGRIAFLPSLTPFSMWHVGHNVVHHGFNNLKGRDFVWEPMDAETFNALPAWRQRVERLYRSAFGPGIYYFVEIWWRRLYFFGRYHLGSRRWQFTADCLLVTAAAAAWIGGLVYAAGVTGQPAWVLLVSGFVVPFILWNWTVGLVIYLHHTAPEIRWFDSKRDWLKESAQATATIRLTLPGPFGALLHHIMEHPAHHLDGTIPLYRLKKAERRLEELLPAVQHQRLTLRFYRECVRRCKLYDYSRQAWSVFPAGPAAQAA